MVIAIIVVACLLAAGLIASFVVVQVQWHREYRKKLPNGEYRPRQSVKEWFKNHLPTKRRLIQVYAALLYNANVKGFISGDIYQSATTKYLCVPGLNCYSCPGAIGACPLGAFQNALAASNTTAPYYMLGIIGLIGLTLARTVCGFLCPVGLGQDLLYKIRTPKLKKSRATRVFSYLKYVILAVLAIAIPLVYAVWNTPLPGFCKYICPAGTFGGAVMLLLNPSNTDLFTQIGPLFTWKFCVLVAVVVAAIFIYRFFCRFFCPLGAIYGFFNRIALLGVKVDKDNCINCGKCVAACKMDVKHVGDHECINCGECISVCPTKAIRWKGSKLFLRGAAIREAAAEAEVKPINLANGTPNPIPEPAPKPSETAIKAESVAEAVKEPSVVSEAAEKLDVITAPAADEAIAHNEAHEEAAGEAQAVKPKRKKRSTSFWLQLSAWIAALLLLVGALVYYNFIDVEKNKVGNEVGQIAPDFTAELYDSDETFTLYKNRDKITVIYFWSAADTPAELSYVNELSEKHTDWNVIAIHSDPEEEQSVGGYITANCSDWKLTFALDRSNEGESEIYRLFGGEFDLPMTVCVDKSGKIVYKDIEIFGSYSALESAILENFVGYKVGDTAPDFTVQLYKPDGSLEGDFTLYKNRGRVTVVNFWATWCTPCIEELPFFNELSQKHTELNVIAIHGSPTTVQASDYIPQNFSEYTLTFAQDNLQGKTCLTYKALGGRGAWPMTVIIDEEGTVIYNSIKSFGSYNELETTVLAAIG